MYLGDVPTVALTPGVEQVLNAGVPTVSLTPTAPTGFTVRLPSFEKPKLSQAEIAAISGAVLLFLWSQRGRR